MKTYKKKPLLYDEQVAQLMHRGLTVAEPAKAEMYLSQISYYRLSAYFLPYCTEKDKFNEGTTFENVLDMYLFDRELRLLVFDAIERIEIAIRCQLIYILAHKYKDSHWQDNAAIFHPPYTNPRNGYTHHIYADTQDIIEKHKNAKHPEVFVKHYKTTYNDPPNPPSWMSLELLTIGELSRLFSALKDNADKQAVSQFFGLHHTVFSSWLHTLVYVRNICAHHARLWNREFAIKPEVLLRPAKSWISPAYNSNNHRAFYFLSILKYLMISANPSNHFKDKFLAIIAKYPTVPIKYLGIPTTDGTNLANWAAEPLWK